MVHVPSVRRSGIRDVLMGFLGFPIVLDHIVRGIVGKLENEPLTRLVSVFLFGASVSVVVCLCVKCNVRMCSQVIHSVMLGTLCCFGVSTTPIPRTHTFEFDMRRMECARTTYA